MGRWFQALVAPSSMTLALNSEKLQVCPMLCQLQKTIVVAENVHEHCLLHPIPLSPGKLPFPFSFLPTHSADFVPHNNSLLSRKTLCCLMFCAAVQNRGQGFSSMFSMHPIFDIQAQMRGLHVHKKFTLKATAVHIY